MTNEHVEELYGKFGKSVAKNKREDLKASLKDCDNEKFEELKKFEPKCKNPLHETVGIISWVATLIGFLFIVINLIIYAYVVPVNADKTEFATKLSADMTDYAKVAAYELNDAYSQEASIWSTEQILGFVSPEYTFETLSDELAEFEKIYADFKTALKSATDAYNKAIEEASKEYDEASKETEAEQEAALAVLNAAKQKAGNDLTGAAMSAENSFIVKFKDLPVLEGQDVEITCSAYKTKLNEYLDVLNDSSSTEGAIAAAREIFDRSSEKVKYEELLTIVRDYLAKAKTVINTVKALEEGQPYVLSGAVEYFGGSSNGGAIDELNEKFNAYTAAVAEYEGNLSKASDGSLLWLGAPLCSDVNRIIVTASDLRACQNDFIAHLNMYKSVINGLPERLEEISGYYNADGIYNYSVYIEDKNYVTFSYFTCNIDTMKSVLGNTDFENNKNEFNKTVENFKNLKFAVNTANEKYLVKDFHDGLTVAAETVKEAINDFNSAVTGLINISSQANTLVQNCNRTSDMLSTIVMVFDIIFAIIIAVYWLAVVFIYRGQAQEANLKALKQIINN
ncbi:MAG: hypothetical protein K2O89_03450 [Clostridia bacterium]|nr:hypothetical protein [Clostridia bacterium]